MIDDKIIKKYKRFLKENGIYQRAIELHSYHNCKKTILSLYGDIKKFNFKSLLAYNPKDWMQSTALFCLWSGTKEGEKYWFEKSILWLSQCCETHKDMTDLLAGIECFNRMYGKYKNSKINEIEESLNEKLKELNVVYKVNKI